MKGRHAERPGTPYRTCCKSCNENEREKTISKISKATVLFGTLPLDALSKIADVVKNMNLMKYFRQSK